MNHNCWIDLDGSDEFTLGFFFAGLLFGPLGAVWASHGEAEQAIRSGPLLGQILATAKFSFSFFSRI